LLHYQPNTPLLQGFYEIEPEVRIALVTFGCLWVGTDVNMRGKLFRQLVIVLGAVIIFLVLITVKNLSFSPDHTFQKDVAGIVVLRITGDDDKHSLQRRLVNSMETVLSKQSLAQKIEVLASEQGLEEIPSAQKHAQARKIGQKLRALLVVWGDVDAGKTAFDPRITIVQQYGEASLVTERFLDVQNISNLNNFPAVLFNEPICLVHFVIGYSFYARMQYDEALRHFEMALKRNAVSPDELIDLKSFTGACHLHLAQGQEMMDAHLRAAIGYFQETATYFQSHDAMLNWAMTQNNMGRAYGDLRTGDLAANSQQAIAAFEASLRIYTEKDFAPLWAGAHHNLGRAYSHLRTGDKGANLQRAITAFETALRVFTEKDYPTAWAMTQNNLGGTYYQLQTGDPATNCQKAMAAFESSLRVRTVKDYPVEWANTQNNLGNVYSNLPNVMDAKENLLRALTFYEAALRVFTEKDFPAFRAMTQNNQAKTYFDLATIDSAKKEISIKGKTYRRFLPPEEKTAYFQKAMAAHQAALRVFTETDFPAEWADTQQQLGLIYAFMPSGDCEADLSAATVCCDKALRVYTPDNFPADYQNTCKLRNLVHGQLKSIQSSGTPHASATTPSQNP
jgi:tetratricopeptide (TPR) repeat protein